MTARSRPIMYALLWRMVPVGVPGVTIWVTATDFSSHRIDLRGSV